MAFWVFENALCIFHDASGLIFVLNVLNVLNVCQPKG